MYIDLILKIIDGDIDQRVRVILRSLGLEIVIWNRDTLDCKNNTIKVQGKKH